MAQHPGLAGEVPDDVLGQFLRDAFLQGRLPGDQGSNLQFVLSMLSPGAVQGRRELLSPAVEAANRIPPEDIQQAIESSLGLRTSPVEQFNTAQNLFSQFDISPAQAQEITASLAPQGPRQTARELTGATPPRQVPTERLESREQQALGVKTQRDFNSQRRQILLDIMTQARVNDDARQLLILARQDSETANLLNVLAGLEVLRGDDDTLKGVPKALADSVVERIAGKLGFTTEKVGRIFKKLVFVDKGAEAEAEAETDPGPPAPTALENLSPEEIDALSDEELLEAVREK